MTVRDLNAERDLDRLIDRVCDQIAAPEELAALGRLLVEDPAVRDRYLSSLELHAGLAWHMSPGRQFSAEELLRYENGDSEFAVQDWKRAETGLSLGEPALDVPPAPPRIIIDPTATGRYRDAGSPFVGGFVFSYMVASIFMCLLLLGFWAYKLPSDRGSSIASSDNSRRSTTSGEASSSDRPAPVFVGRVTGIAGAKWSDEPNYIAPLGYRVALGRTYKLKSGLLEITYDSGAKVILEGPCSYEVDSTAGGYLALGKLTAKVASGEWRVASDNSRRLTASGNNTAMAQTPEAVSLRLLSESTNPRIHSPLATNPSSLIPHPSSFVIRTPTAVVTDLGTEFGVEVAENGDTLSYVFQGIVKVQGLAASVASGPAPMETILRVDESARVVRNAGGPRLVLGGTVGNIPRFVQKIPDQSMLSDQSFAIDGRVFQDDFDGTSIDAAKWSLVLKHDGSISVAEGASNVNSGSSLVKTLAWMYSTEPLEFGKVSTDWWLEIRFKIEGPLASSTFSAVRDWIVCAGGSGPVKNMSIRGFDIRAMQRGPVDGDAYDLGWYGWDGTNENRIPTAIARKLEKGRYYTAAIHRKPDQTVDIYLGGRLIANRQLIDAANPVVLLCGDKSVMVGGRQTTDYVKIGTPTENESTTQDENRKEESSMRQ